MQTVEKKCPLVRFKGFTDDWVELPLRAILIENQIPVKAPDGEYIRLGIRSHAKGTFHEVVPAGKGLAVDTMYMVEADNFIVNITFAWEHAVAITNEDDAGKLVSHRFPQYKFPKIFSPQFFQYSILDSKFRYDLELASPGGAGRNRVLNKNSLLNITRNCPTTLDEQTHIGTLFIALDNLITFHQRKLDQLTAFKKAMLGKMFPQEGERVPEVRFSGFTDDWEQCKLGELCTEFQSGKAIKADNIHDIGQYPVYGGNGFRGYTDKYNHEGLYALIGRQGALCGNMNISTGKAYFTEHAVAVRGNSYNETEFLFYLLKTMNLRQYSCQSAQPGLAVNKLVNLSASVPKSDEQHKISNFFKSLDNLITHHQHKLTVLQQAKKSLLQKMFI